MLKVVHASGWASCGGKTFSNRRLGFGPFACSRTRFKLSPANSIATAGDAFPSRSLIAAKSFRRQTSALSYCLEASNAEAVLPTVDCDMRILESSLSKTLRRFLKEGKGLIHFSDRVVPRCKVAHGGERFGVIVTQFHLQKFQGIFEQRQCKVEFDAARYPFARLDLAVRVLGWSAPSFAFMSVSVSS